MSKVLDFQDRNRNNPKSKFRIRSELLALAGISPIEIPRNQNPGPSGFTDSRPYGRFPHPTLERDCS